MLFISKDLTVGDKILKFRNITYIFQCAGPQPLLPMVTVATPVKLSRLCRSHRRIHTDFSAILVMDRALVQKCEKALSFLMHCRMHLSGGMMRKNRTFKWRTARNKCTALTLICGTVHGLYRTVHTQHTHTHTETVEPNRSQFYPFSLEGVLELLQRQPKKPTTTMGITTPPRSHHTAHNKTVFMIPLLRYPLCDGGL